MTLSRKSNPVVALALTAFLQGCDFPTDVQTKVEIIDPESAGAKLLVKYCSDCHAPPSPLAHPAKEWSNVVYRMHERRRMNAHTMMTDDEVAELTAYLELHAKKES